MTIMSGAAGNSAKAAPSGDVITLSGETTTAFAFGGANADAHLKIDNDGNIYEQSNFGGYIQVDTGTDWIRPTTSSPGLYEVRYTSLVGDTFISQTAAEDVWHSLSGGDFILRLRQLGGGFDVAIASITIEIRLNGGAVLASGAYVLTASTEL